uniref:Cytochrome b6-f complex subunit PetP n=1 Tax=Cyanothece sp. (strain PCC 7425 / ATCC 29141) TaxID=395961 RepID=B8HKD7_CYAP4
MDVGQKVRVCRIRDRVAQDIRTKLGQVGIVQGFKMTDGSGVGALVKFEDRSATWFFEDELEPAQ